MAVFGQTPCQWCQHYEKVGPNSWKCGITKAELSLMEYLEGNNCPSWKIRTKKEK